MLDKLLDAFFGCWHGNYSFPVSMRGTRRRVQAASLTGTYVTCLDCGKEFAYDWKEMRVISSASERKHYLRSLAAKEAS